MTTAMPIYFDGRKTTYLVRALLRMRERTSSPPHLRDFSSARSLCVYDPVVVRVLEESPFYYHIILIVIVDVIVIMDA